LVDKALTGLIYLAERTVGTTEEDLVELTYFKWPLRSFAKRRSNSKQSGI
jgi:hypothetical protein